MTSNGRRPTGPAHRSSGRWPCSAPPRVGGIFFAFSSFVMKALAGVPSAEGIGAMQSINVVVLNPSFLGAFMGTAVVSLGAGGLA